MTVETLITCHQHAFDAFGGIPKRILYDNMKTVVIERDASGAGAHHFHAGFLDYAHHCGFVIKLCRPYRAKTKGKVERFNGYLRRSFYVPLVAQLKQAGLSLDAVTAYIEEVRRTQMRPATRLQTECLQPIPSPWRGDIRAARPQCGEVPAALARPVSVIEQIAQATTPPQHPLAVYERLLEQTVAA